MMKGLRPEWLRHTVTQCQILAGCALPDHDLPMRAIDAFVHSVRRPESRVEALVLRGLLLDATLHWGTAHHAAYHERDGSMLACCAFEPAGSIVVVWQARGEEPIRLLEKWSVEYGRLFQRHHRGYAARELRRQFHARPETKVEMGQFAREHGISGKRLQMEFKELTGSSPREYLNRQRVDKAIHLLEATNDKVEWIARSVGWSSRKNLNRALARHLTLTPAQVRAPRVRPARVESAIG